MISNLLKIKYDDLKNDINTNLESNRMTILFIDLDYLLDCYLNIEQKINKNIIKDENYYNNLSIDIINIISHYKYFIYKYMNCIKRIFILYDKNKYESFYEHSFKIINSVMDFVENTTMIEVLDYKKNIYKYNLLKFSMIKNYNNFYIIDLSNPNVYLNILNPKEVYHIHYGNMRLKLSKTSNFFQKYFIKDISLKTESNIYILQYAILLLDKQSNIWKTMRINNRLVKIDQFLNENSDFDDIITLNKNFILNIDNNIDIVDFLSECIYNREIYLIITNIFKLINKKIYDNDIRFIDDLIKTKDKRIQIERLIK